MALTNPKNVVTEERLNEYHRTILPYLGGNSMVACGGGYAPIGTVIAYMGTRAPSDFLICDGTVYNIADYTELADFFEAQFGSANFFGGDGATTFAVPDLRGEFLRGTGTNSHANQGSGANVGVHQDGTYHHNLNYDSDSNFYIPYLLNASGGGYAQNRDSIVDISNSNNYYVLKLSKNNNWNIPDYYTSRPTNTSVLYCIKAKSQGNGYSLDEQIVGTWIDGKPIYQKTVSFTGITNGKTIALNISNVADVININGIVYLPDKSVWERLPGVASSNAYIRPQFIKSSNSVELSISGFQSWAQGGGAITLQYTKTTD